MGKPIGSTGANADIKLILAAAGAAAGTASWEDGVKVGTTAPASAGATGTAGEIRVVDGFIYACVATDTWQRVAIATWV